MFNSFNVAATLLSLLVSFGAMALVFLALRAVFLWYWRVNRMVELLESIDARLLALGGRTDDASPTRTYASTPRS